MRAGDPRQASANPDALHLMGAVALMAEQVDSAIDLLTRAASGKPGDPAIRCNLANALLRRGDPAAAQSHLKKALKKEPGNPAALCFLAESKAAAGDMTGAKRIYDELLLRLPENPQAMLGYADLSVTLGDFPKARELYRKALALGSFSALALGGLASFEKFSKDAPEATEIVRLLKTAPLKPNERVSLGYAAGAIAENAGDYDDAFAHFAEAKRFSGSRFDPASQKEVFATLKRVFSEEFLEERKSWGDKSPRPVFIVGMPRSGTTLTEQILARHPEMAAGGELGDLGAIASSLGFRAVDAGAFAKRLPKLTMKETKELARRYLAVLDRVSLPAARVTDKMPHNFQHLGLVALLFPNARIIHCRREPARYLRLLLYDAASRPHSRLCERPLDAWRLLPRVCRADAALAEGAPAAGLRTRLRALDRGPRNRIPQDCRVRRAAVGSGLPGATGIRSACEHPEPHSGAPADLWQFGWPLASLRETSRPTQGGSRRPCG